MDTVLSIVYLLGVVGAAGVGRHRAGISQRGRLTADLIFRSLRWFGTQMLTMFLWPIFLVVWLVRGRPESPWEMVSGPHGSFRVHRRASR